MQQNIETTKVTITKIIPKDIFSPFIKPVITIVITTRHTSIGNSKIKLPQSLFSLSFEMKYFNNETSNKRKTDNQKAR